MKMSLSEITCRRSASPPGKEPANGDEVEIDIENAHSHA